MNGKEVVMMADLVAREKGLPIEKVLSSLEAGFSTALKKNYPAGSEVEVSIDTKKNSIEAWRVFYIVDKVDDFETQTTLKAAKEEMSEGDFIEDGVFYQKIEMNLSRQQFNITKQVALQKLKTEIKENILDTLADKKDGLLVGVVKAKKRENVTLEFANMDVVLPRSEWMPKDRFDIGNRVFFVMDKTVRTATNTVLYGTRASEKFVLEVLKKEVALIEEGKIVVNQISRIPGSGSKVALSCANPKIDPIKEVVGQRAATAKKIRSYFNGENMDFVLFNDDPTQFLINCIQPLSPLKLSVDEDTKAADIVVKEEDFEYSQKPNYKKHIEAMTGWQVTFYSENAWNTLQDKRNETLVAMFEKTLDVDSDIAQSLVNLQFEGLEEVAFTPTSEFLEDESFDEETVVEIKERAKAALDNPELSCIEHFVSFGLDMPSIEKLNASGVKTVEQLSEMDIFELEEVLPDTQEDFRKNVILKARAV